LAANPDPDRFALLEILILAKGEALHPYSLPKKLADGRAGAESRNKRLGYKLKNIIHEAKLIVHASRNKAPSQSLKQDLNGNYADEEIRQHALEIVKDHIIFSSITPDEYQRWWEGEVEALDRVSEQVDAFIKNVPKRYILNE